MSFFNSNDLEILKKELQRPELRVYTVVVMASLDLENGDVAGALARLRIDADKLRAHNTQITRLLRTAN
ncbi:MULTISPECIES: hypothetical protein [Delftia]|uniref:Uncharacterized protein n=1 Tax=Delftia lacustris TaxID=558537 RepID=A0A7T2Z062_9BURK|nr:MULTISPECIES: hypothetical protein [Delftia]QPS78381.1 hypothetical protein I6G48_32195 [Delftia acidovorans]QPS84941.1 hypothetical protein I6G47_32870 [Delftia lacustris]